MDEIIVPSCLCCGKNIDYSLYIKSGKTRKFCDKNCTLQYRTIEAKERASKNCAFCHVLFKAKSVSKTKYCSKNCAIKSNKAKSRRCNFCGIEFSPVRWQQTKNRFISDKANIRDFCSGLCSHNFKLANKEKVCASCRILFTPIRFDYRGKKYVPYDIPTTCCKECNLKAYPFTEERKRKQSKRLQGNCHPNWQGGSHRQSFRGSDWAIIAKDARTKADYKCEHCGKTEYENGRRLDVHHKIPFHQHYSKEESNKPRNLEALCKSCHQKADWQWRKSNSVQMCIAFSKAGL